MKTRFDGRKQVATGRAYPQGKARPSQKRALPDELELDQNLKF